MYVHVHMLDVRHEDVMNTHMHMHMHMHMYTHTPHTHTHTHRRVSQVVGHFIQSVLNDREKKLSATEYIDDPLVQQCTVLQQKLKSLQITLQVRNSSVSV